MLLILLLAQGDSSELSWKPLSLAGPHALLSSSVPIGLFYKIWSENHTRNCGKNESGLKNNSHKHLVL